MTDKRTDHPADPDDVEKNPPGPADHGGHGGMATRENSTADDED